MSNSNTENAPQAQERHEKAMQWLRQHYIEAYEKHQHLFPEVEAELREFESKQAALNQSKPKAARKPRPAAKRVQRQAKKLTR